MRGVDRSAVSMQVPRLSGRVRAERDGAEQWVSLCWRALSITCRRLSNYFCGRIGQEQPNSGEGGQARASLKPTLPGVRACVTCLLCQNNR